MNQQQVPTALMSGVCGWNRYSAERIDSIYDFTTEERGLAKGFFGAYTDKLKSIYLPQDEKENFEHIARQTYIALALVMAQAAELKIDSTPMEGFYNDQLDELLNTLFPRLKV
jgi:nitroreductase